MQKNQIGKKLARYVNCDVVWDKHMRDSYSVDASSYRIIPSAIAFPKTELDVVRILRFASRNKISVTPRGGGTGLVGGALGRDIIIDMKFHDSVKIRDGYVEAGGGVSKGKIDKELHKVGRFLGPNPSVGPFCTIGGMIGTNASGSNSLKYGSVIDNLLQVKFVTPKGDIITLPSKKKIAKKILATIISNRNKKFPAITKNSCGYRIDRVKSGSELHKVIAGSEGTLGVIVSAKMRTFPIPSKSILIIISYKTLRDAVIDVPAILRLGPASVEIIDHNIISNIKDKILKGTKSLLFVQFDGNVQDKKTLVKNLISGKIISSSSKTKEITYWQNFRNQALTHSIRATKQCRMPSLIEDAAVPVHRLPLFLDLVDHLISKYDMKMIIYGHAGNGNLHIRPVIKKPEKKMLKTMATEFFSAVISIGGSITGEHGDGLARSEFVKLQYGDKTYEIFKKLKKCLDPVNTLNPGKIISQHSTIVKNMNIEY